MADKKAVYYANNYIQENQEGLMEVSMSYPKKFNIVPKEQVFWDSAFGGELSRAVSR